MPDNNKSSCSGSLLGTISALIGIFVFATGIASLPQLMGLLRLPNGLTTGSFQSPIEISPSDKAEIVSLMERWDQIHIETDKTLDSAPLSEVLAADALTEQNGDLQQLRSKHCYWEISINEPMELRSLAPLDADYAKVEVIKDQNMDQICSGKRLSMPQYDGNYSATYWVRRIHGQWFIVNQLIQDIP